MAKARSITFPHTVQKNGRLGKVYRFKSGNSQTHFLFAGATRQNRFRTFDAACLYLEKEFDTLDTDRANAASLHPLNSDVRTYSELEQVLHEKAPGVTLREVANYF